MFHTVNGDWRGNGKLGIGKLQSTPAQTPAVNKGDRGCSDQTEARIYHIGGGPNHTPTR